LRGKKIANGASLRIKEQWWVEKREKRVKGRKNRGNVLNRKPDAPRGVGDHHLELERGALVERTITESGNEPYRKVESQPSWEGD